MFLLKALVLLCIVIALGAKNTKPKNRKVIPIKDRCAPLPFVDHGTYKIISKNKVQIICDPPYEYIDLQRQWDPSTVIQCKKGNWSNPEPVCLIPTNKCDPPEPIENGRYTEYLSYPGGSTVQYSCDNGFLLVGPTIRTCHNGMFKWTDDNPFCKKYDPSIEGLAERLNEQVDKINVVSNGSGNLERIIGHDVEFLGLDLFLIFDKSSSILPSEFALGIKFAQFLIERFNVANGDIDKEGGTRLSILTFGDDLVEVLTLDDTSVSTTRMAQQKLEGIKCGAVCDGSTNMGAALARAYFLAKHASREEAKKALFITSDGVPDDVEAVKTESAKLKKIDVEIYAIGIGKEVVKELLADIASTPSLEHVFLLDKFSDFDEMIKVIREKPTPSPPPSLDKCGYSADVNLNPGPIDLVSSPWLAAIIISDGPNSMFSCSGALVCEQWVLTTATCLESRKIVDNSAVYVVLGETNLARDSKTKQYFYAEDIHLNDGFSSGKIQDDLALIKLNKKAKFNDHVRPLCISRSDTISTRPGNQLLMTGWLTMNEESTRIKDLPLTSVSPSQVNVTIQAIEDCAAKLDKPIECKDKGTGAASVGIEFSKKCKDSPGSLLTNNVDGRSSLIGLVAKGRGCDIQNKIAFFARINLHYDWLDEVTSFCFKEHM